MVSRTILIHSEARKNKSYRQKYFVLTVGENYSNPRLHYFSCVDKWNQHKEEFYDDIAGDLSFRTIDLGRLFFVDDVHRSKPKQGGLDLYMEDRRVSIVLSSEDLKKRWREILENVVFKNGKTHSFPTIEHALQVCLRLKPREHIDKIVLHLLRGDFRACFLRGSLIFIDKDLEKPILTIQYPFIRQWESRLDGTLRLEIGRAALIGECALVMHLSDHLESKAAHLMLTDCIKKSKSTRPEPPRSRSNHVKSSRLNDSVSSNVRSYTVSTGRSDSCIAFSGNDTAPAKCSTRVSEDQEEDSYVPMQMDPGDGKDTTKCARNCSQHVGRICKCPTCDSLMKFITFCPTCSDSAATNRLRMLHKTEDSISSSLRPFVRTKAQSLTERPTIPFLSLRSARLQETLSVHRKSGTSLTSSSRNEMSLPMLDSQTSLISANRHDDDIFMELDFQELHRPTKVSTTKRTPPRCSNCSSNLELDSMTERSSLDQCPLCSSVMLSLPVLITIPDCLLHNSILVGDCDYVDVEPANLRLDYVSK